VTLNELIEELQAIVESDEELGEAEVQLATQPNYPLAFAIDTVTADHCGDAPVVWIAEGGHPREGSPYAPKHAWDGGEVFGDEDEEEQR
jgi:hypothetical protein